MKDIRLKMVLSACLVLIGVAQANACIGELQFQGKARNVEACKFSIDFTYASSNITCPLDIDDINQKVTGECDVKEGDDVSGVIVQHADGSFSID